MTQKISRRLALTSGLAAGAASCASSPKMTPFTSASQSTGGVFAHGVASGDPDANSVIIWTRLTPEGSPNAVDVDWEVSSDDSFADIKSAGATRTSQSKDWTVKILADGLAPGQTYYFRFRSGAVMSPTGRTRTLPVGSVENARFAIISCSNYPFGFFNVYDQIAREDDLNAVLHLGDYLYEYGPDGYGAEVGRLLGRPHNPPREIVSLTDYRERHAQYKSDPSAQAMHARHPMIPIWDDHETTNNSWKDGAQNHQPDSEGDWNARRRAALQAYYEWMPVREPEMTPEAFFRSFSFGDLLTLAALETRLMARAEQFEYSDVVPTLKTPEDIARFRDVILWDETRAMLGDAQLDYLDRVMRESASANQPWRLIANQIIMAKVTAPNLSEYVTEEDIVALEKQWDQARAFVEFSKLGLPSNLDAWDGYPAARERFYDLARSTNAADGMIVVTGDTHTWWANDLTAKDGAHMGVELGTHSVTSPSPYRPDFLGGKGSDYALLTNRENKAVRYLSGEHHGYIHLTINRTNARAEFRAVDTVEKVNYNAYVKASFDIERTSNGAEFGRSKGLGFKERILF